MKNVLVTGGTGFIGSNLSAALSERGYNVRILRRSGSNLLALTNIDAELVVGDLRDQSSLVSALKGCDTVFHVGALVSYWRKQRDEMYDINIGGTRNMVKACLGSNIERLVHTSSIAAVGFSEDGKEADENTPFNWGSYDIGYRTSKFKGEEEIRNGFKEGLPAVVVNPSVVIGERDIHFNGGQIIRDVYKKRLFFSINGGMSVAYVGDVVNGHIQAALKGRIGERYILSGENLTYHQLLSTTADVVGGIRPLFRLPLWCANIVASTAEIVGERKGTKPWVTRELLAGLNVRNWFSCAKATLELGYTKTSYRTAAQRTFEWYRNNGFL